MSRGSSDTCRGGERHQIIVPENAQKLPITDMTLNRREREWSVSIPLGVADELCSCAQLCTLGYIPEYLINYKFRIILQGTLFPVSFSTKCINILYSLLSLYKHSLYEC